MDKKEQQQAKVAFGIIAVVILIGLLWFNWV